MTKILPYLFLLLNTLCVSQGNWCGAKQYESPGKAAVYADVLARVKANELNPAIHFRTNETIPVVIHSVIGPGYHPITIGQALQQIEILNRDFAARGENFDKLPEAFKAISASADFDFVLAYIDPDGQFTTGITYTPTSEQNIGTSYDHETGRRVIQYDELGGKTGWDPTRYINIWVGECDQIFGSSSMPGEATYPEEIGIVIDIRHFGNFGDAGYFNAFGRGHTLTHEMGHFLGLRHIWGQGLSENCSDSDDIDDTPNAAGPYYDCPHGEQFSCGVSNMYQNFMDLTDDRCLAAFTQDQVTRMTSAIDLFYPQLLTDSLTCIDCYPDFDPWFEGLIWSTDRPSDKFIVYNIHFVVELNKTVRVFSMDGRLVFEDQWGFTASHLIDLQGVPSGVYVVNIQADQHSRSKKIVIY